MTKKSEKYDEFGNKIDEKAQKLEMLKKFRISTWAVAEMCIQHRKDLQDLEFKFLRGEISAAFLEDIILPAQELIKKYQLNKMAQHIVEENALRQEVLKGREFLRNRKISN